MDIYPSLKHFFKKSPFLDPHFWLNNTFLGDTFLVGRTSHPNTYQHCDRIGNKWPITFHETDINFISFLVESVLLVKSLSWEDGARERRARTQGSLKRQGRPLKHPREEVGILSLSWIIRMIK